MLFQGNRTPEWLIEFWIRYRDSAFSTYFVPFVISVPASILGVASLSAVWPNIVWLSSFHDWLGVRSILFPFLCFFPLSLLLFRKIGRSLDKRIKKLRELDAETYLMLLYILDEIVGSKEQAHKDSAELLLERGGHPISPEDLVQVFHRPEARIKALAAQCYKFFGFMIRDPSAKLRVFVAVMGDKHVESIKYHYPENEDIGRPITSLQTDNATLSVCKNRRKLIVIQDIMDELQKAPSDRRYQEANGDGYEDKGSILCFPVFGKVKRDIPYVVCVHTDKPNVFGESKSEVVGLDHIVGRFAARMKFEYTRLTLMNDLKSY